MKKTIFIIGLCALIQNVTGQSIGYLTPKKFLLVSVPYTISQLKKVDSTGKTIGVPIITVSITDDITIEEKMVFDTYKNIDLSKLGKAGRNYTFAVDFDSGGLGTLSTINGSQEPIAGDIIKGTVSIAGTILNAIGALKGYVADKKTSAPKLTDVTITQKIVEKRIVEIVDDDQNIEIKPEIQNVPSIPLVAIHLKKQNVDIKPNKIVSDNADSYHITYNIPAIYKLTAQVLNNNLCKTQTVIDQFIFVPQKGIETDLPLPILKGKKTIEIDFSSSTGNLTKFSLKKESQLSSTLSASQTSLDDLNKSITDFKARFKDTSLSDEVAKLTLENQKLQLQISQKQLQGQLNN